MTIPVQQQANHAGTALTRTDVARLLQKVESPEQLDVSGQDLSGINLMNCDLQGASLSRVSVCAANLCGANLSKADVHGTDLRGTYLCWADSRGPIQVRPIYARLTCAGSNWTRPPCMGPPCAGATCVEFPGIRLTFVGLT
jgi:hypothetical protein